jgi:hypothetical protein
MDLYFVLYIIQVTRIQILVHPLRTMVKYLKPNILHKHFCVLNIE